MIRVVVAGLGLIASFAVRARTLSLAEAPSLFLLPFGPALRDQPCRGYRVKWSL